MRANTKITFEMFDTDSKPNSSPSCEQCQTDIQTLKNEKADTSNYATTETNGLFLDGSYEFLKDTLPAGLYSDTMSDASGNLTTAVVLSISFSVAVTGNGITLYFPEGEYPSRVNIKWLSGDNVLHEGEFYPDSTAFFCQGRVENYNGLILTFTGTQLPGHYIKLRGIDFGQALVFGSKDIITANVNQEIDLLCDEISINTLEFSVKDKDKMFSVVNADGIFFAVQENQRISVDTTIDGKEENIGTFYLQNVTSGGVTAQFRAQDEISQLNEEDKIPDTYFDTNFETFCSQVLEGRRYVIDESLKKETIRGYLTECSRREAFQQACFAVGAVVDTQGSDGIKIYPLSQRPSQLITSGQIFAGGKVENIKPVRTVNITTHEFDAEGNDTTSEFSAAVNSKAKGSLTVRDAVFVNQNNVEKVSERLAAHYKNKVKYLFSVPLDKWYQMGDMLMTYLENSYIKGNVAQMNINLSGGLTADIVVYGQLFEITNNVYTGEVYTGERGDF